jgi:non-heme chloroperoxidase
LTYDQFRFGFASSVSEQEAKELYDQFHVAGSGVPLLQAAFANVNPGSEVKAKKAEDRGPMLVLVGEEDHQAPPAIARATYGRQAKNE